MAWRLEQLHSGIRNTETQQTKPSAAIFQLEEGLEDRQAGLLGGWRPMAHRLLPILT